MMRIHKKAFIKRGLARLIVMFIIFMKCFSIVCAEESDQSYLYGEDDFVKAPIAAEPGRDVDHTVFQTSSLKKPEDLFATEDFLYIADTGNNRILKLDKDYRLIKEYYSYEYEEKEVFFQAPSGIFVDHEENILIADKNNKRLVKIDAEGNLIITYEAPKSNLLPADFNYLPSKVVCDEAGRIFVAVSGFNMGLIELDKGGNFVQLLGASKVTYSIIDAFWRLISTKEQQKRMESFVPAEYNNISIDEDGFIFATTGTLSQRSKEGYKFVRKLNAKGDDVLNRSDNEVCGDLSYSQLGSIKGPSQIVDCVNLSDGMYAILDAKRARVFVYDKFGTMLFIFGELGQTEGTLTSPTSLVMFQGHFLILDGVKNKIVSYNFTEYGTALLEACHYREVNEFEAEEAAWQKVYNLNNNHPAIVKEMGKIAYRQRDMQQAMYLFKEAQEQNQYSKAFQFFRRDMINKYFNLFGITVIFLIIVRTGIKIFIKYWRKQHPKSEKKAGSLRYTTYVIFRPLDGFWDLKRERRGSLKVAVSIMVIAGFVPIFQSLITGFIFNNVNLEYYNFIWDLLTVYAPLLLWVVCTWAITTLMDGEGTFKDIVTATGYSMTPLIIILPCVAVFSNILIKDEGVLCIFFINVAYIWMICLLIASVMQTHNYSLGKTIGVILISLLVILIVVFLLLLCFALLQQMLAFGIDLKDEIINRW